MFGYDAKVHICMTAEWGKIKEEIRAKRRKKENGIKPAEEKREMTE